MSDNATLPATGIPVATDDVGGTHYQRMKLVDGTPDSTTPIKGDGDGRMYVEASVVASLVGVLEGIVGTLATASDPATGRLRILLDAITASLTLATITTVGTVTTCNTVTNTAQLGAVAANSMVFDAMQSNWAHTVRGRIS